MVVQCPMPQWPEVLLEDGPPADRSILLRGEVAIGNAVFRLVAVRVNPIRFAPDYRADLESDVYSRYDLTDMLDRLSEMMDIADGSQLRLETGSYILWMLPNSEG